MPTGSATLTVEHDLMGLRCQLVGRKHIGGGGTSSNPTTPRPGLALESRGAKQICQGSGRREYDPGGPPSWSDAEGI
jgi:hypothetical protein